jgi:hypothetical protein
VTWTLNASGHQPGSHTEPERRDAEEKLYAELQAVLAKPEHGASNSAFHGNFVHGEPHFKAEDSTQTIDGSPPETSAEELA